MKKFLFLLDSSTESMEAIEKFLQFAPSIGAQIVFLFPLDRNSAIEIAQRSGRRLAQVIVELEETAWKHLYWAQEKSLEKGIACQLVLQEGDPFGVTMKTLREINADAIVIARSSNPLRSQFVKKVLETSPVPILIY